MMQSVRDGSIEKGHGGSAEIRECIQTKVEFKVCEPDLVIQRVETSGTRGKLAELVLIHERPSISKREHPRDGPVGCVNHDHKLRTRGVHNAVARERSRGDDEIGAGKRSAKWSERRTCGCGFVGGRE